MFPNLRAEMARKKLTAASMAPQLEMKERTLANKIAGKTEFKWTEILKLRRKFFPECSIEYLFAEQERSTA